MLPANVEKLLGDLQSQNVNLRMQAVEELGKLGVSHERIVIALEKIATSDANPFDGSTKIKEMARKLLQSQAHQEILKQQGRSAPMSDAEKMAQMKELSQNILLTTTPFVDGYIVQKYFGVISAEVVLGTGGFSELGAGIADFFGTRAESFQNKLKQATSLALDELRLQAVGIEADAVIGVDFDYTILSSNILMVVANGTAVKIVPIKD